MTWQDALALSSGLISFIVLLGSALGRETIGELKRRLTAVEAENAQLKATIAAQATAVGVLQERTNGMAAGIGRIEAQMVPRTEWEARHSSTEALLQRILNRLDDHDRDSGAQLEPPPPMRRPRGGG